MSDSEDKGTEGQLTESAIDRLLTPAERKKVALTSARLARRLDHCVHLWVRDARTLRHGVESNVPYFSLQVAPAMIIADIRREIQDEFARLSSYTLKDEGPLGLHMDGQLLRDDKKLATYLSRQAKPKWPAPFAGIIWVVPWRRS